MKSKLLITGFIVALAVPFAAVAADTPAADNSAPTEKPPAAKKKVKPHYHPEANKQGAPAPETTPRGEARKPLHEHPKEHKQQ